MSKLHILPLSADPVFHVGSLAVTNSHLGLMLVSLLVAAFGLYVSSTAKLVPGKGQMLFELAVGWIYDRVEDAVPYRPYVNLVFGLIATLFLLIVVSNLIFLLPITSLIFGEDHHTLLRVPTSHFSLTVALGGMVVLLSHLLALTIAPVRQVQHFIKLHELLKVRSIGGFFNALLEIFLGLLEIIGQLSRTISISARLFGNIFAGEVMGEVIIQLAQFGAPIPFYLLGVFVGLIQAVVFTLLSVQYIGGMIQGVAPGHSDH